jgi:serine/threonine protein kinase
MVCPQCQHENPPELLVCRKCRTPFPEVTSAVTGAVGEGWSSPAGLDHLGAAAGQVLKPGTMLAGRYEIRELLGQGGMGAVYKAWDRELERLVALKVIRSELASNPEALRRFKQELILARQVTHRNVIRIYDLGEANGAKFITMEYIEGRDLKALLNERGKLPSEEAARIITQVASALEAAHAEGVIHRDLKPQNIMMDAQGKVSVMDFGIARSVEQSGMTQTGLLMGTPEYMSPEQARGEPIDGRSDLYAVGIIFYELLTGKTPFRADTALATLLKRTQERPEPPRKSDPTIPRHLNDVVLKCLETDPKRRYQSAQEIARDLEGRRAARSGFTTLRLPRFRLVGQLTPRWIAPALAAVVLLLAGAVFWKKILAPGREGQASTPVTSLAVLPFRNASGDPALDWLGPSIAEMLATDVGQSPSLRMVSSDRLHQILRDLRISPGSNYDADTLRRVAEFTSAGKLVWGQYVRVGEQIRIDATLQDLESHQAVPLKTQTPSERELLRAVDELARAIQKNIASSARVVEELQASAFTPSTNSIEALRAYNVGLQLAREGRQLEALKLFEAATAADAEFASAHSKRALTLSRLGYDEDAAQASQKAVDLSERLPPPERFRVQATHARIQNNSQKAIEAYENLARLSPDDTDVLFNLAGLYQSNGELDKARAQYSKLLARDPKFVDALVGMARVEVMAGNPQGGLDSLNRALSLAVQLGNDEQKAVILQGIGVAYKLLNKPLDALRHYEESLEIRRRLGDRGGIALALDALAQVQDLLGQPDGARKSYLEALRLRREIGDRRGIGDTLINLGNFYETRGQYDKALEVTKEALQIQHEMGEPHVEAICLNNIGWIYLGRGDYDEAMTYFQRALQLREKLQAPADIADTLYNLAETSFRMGQYDPALSYYLRALELWRKARDQRGIAIASYGMGRLFEYQGRYGAALSSHHDALSTFRELQERSIWLAQLMSGYANALMLVGRSSEAGPVLEEALGLARELKNDPLLAQILNYQGDRHFYRGELKTAASLYERALKTASQTADRRLILACKLDLAKLNAKGGRSREAAGALRELAREAEGQRMRYHAIESSVYLGEALLNAKDYSGARRELETALRKTEALGLRALRAQAHYLLATTLRLSGQEVEGARHYAEARQILEEIQKEVRDSDVLARSDLGPMYAESLRWSRGPQG